MTRTFEPYRDVLTTADSKWGQAASTSLSKYTYHTNSLGQRDSLVQAGDAFPTYAGTDHAIHETFAYNTRGEPTGAPTYSGSDTTDTTAPLSNRQHEYNYDAIGNRQWVRSGRIGNTLSGVMGYTYRHDAVANSNPDGRDHSFRDARSDGSVHDHRSVRAIWDQPQDGVQAP